MNSKSFMDYTLEEFQALDEFRTDDAFTSIIIVPMDELHESGFRCMRFVLANDNEIVGVVGGYSDVVHPNGIGNYGHQSFEESLATGKIPPMNLSMDCLPASNCIRLMVAPSKIRDGFILSDFVFYTVNESE